MYVVNGVEYSRKEDIPKEYLDGSITSAVDENNTRSFLATDSTMFDKLPKNVNNQTSCLTADGTLGMFNKATNTWNEVG